MSVFKEAIVAARNHFQDDTIDASFLKDYNKRHYQSSVRKFAMAYVRAYNPAHYSYPLIASIFNRSNHTTVMHAVRSAHKEWGEALFRRLSIRQIENDYSRIHSPPAVHASPSFDQMIARGERLLSIELNATFRSGYGWEMAA